METLHQSILAFLVIFPLSSCVANWPVSASEGRLVEVGDSPVAEALMGMESVEGLGGSASQVLCVGDGGMELMGPTTAGRTVCPLSVGSLPAVAAVSLCDCEVVLGAVY